MIAVKVYSAEMNSLGKFLLCMPPATNATLKRPVVSNVIYIHIDRQNNIKVVE